MKRNYNKLKEKIGAATGSFIYKKIIRNSNKRKKKQEARMLFENFFL
jgi:hypothetical protein